METAIIFDLLRPFVGYHIVFTNGYEQDCVSIDTTAFDSIFLDSGRLTEGGTRTGYYVMPHNVNSAEWKGNTLRLIGNNCSGAIIRLHRIEVSNAEETT